MLSAYQLAILKEMGIGVLEPRSDQIPVESEPPTIPSANLQNDANHNLNSVQRLRAQLGQTAKSEQQPVQSSQARDDVMNALLSISLLERTPDDWLLDGDKPIQVTQQVVQLNVNPQKAQGAQKKALWQALVSLSANNDTN